MLGISSRQGDDLLRAMTEPCLRRGRPVCPAEISLCWADLALEHESRHWFDFMAGYSRRRCAHREDKQSSMGSCVTVSYKLAGVTGCRVPGGR